MNTRKAFAVVAASVAFLPLCAVGARADGARSVSLSDASTAPTHLRMVRPGGHATLPDCASGRLPSDIGAYRWDGASIGAQTWRDDAISPRYQWGTRGALVTFDGVTFRNHRSTSVLVAQWCER